jgi:hypothetical protein
VTATTSEIDPSGGRPRVDPVLALAAVLWARWPRTVIRRFPGLAGTAGDGHFLTSVPPLAVLAPPVAFIAGLIVGAGQLGYEQVYTESIPLMAAFIALGVFSNQLGGLAVLGFALGELFLADRTLGIGKGGAFLLPTDRFASGLSGTVAREWLPLLITYLLLATAVVVLPRTARMLVASLGRLKFVPAALAWPLASGLYVMVVWISVRTWAAAAPILVRPRYTWLNTLPNVTQIAPLQTEASDLVAVGVAAAIVRQVVVGATLVPSGFQRRVRWVENAGFEDGPVSPRPPASAVRRLVTDVVASALATLALAGVFEHTWVWVASFSIMLTVRLLRSGLVAAGLVDGWKRVVDKVPAVVRLGGLWLLARVVTDALSNGTIGSYTGVALFVLGGVVVVFLVFPGNATRPDAAGAPNAPGPAGSPQGAPA